MIVFGGVPTFYETTKILVITLVGFVLVRRSLLTEGDSK